jgi:hypothetical protein
MAAQNFRIKNGLNVGSTEVVDSSGDLTAAAFGTAALEAIDDQVNTLLTAGSGIGISYNDGAGTLTITRDAETGDISSVVAGDGLSGGATSGDATLALDLSELTAAAVDVANDSIAIVDASASNGSRKESIADLATAMAGTNITASGGVLSTTADLTGVTAGDGLSGGGTSGAVSLALDLSELTAAAVDVAADSIAIVDANDSNGSKKEAIADVVTAIAGNGLAASSGVLAVGVDGSSVELSSDAVRVKALGITDAMLAGSISNSKLSNSSITIGGSATSLGGTVLANTDALTEGSSNLYHTSERVDDRVNALITEGTGITATYDDAAGTLTLATTITQYTEALVRADVSVTDAGGDGSLAYNNSTGVFTYTGPSAGEVRAHISAGTGVAISNGAISIGQAVGTSDDVTFDDVIVSGNLTVNGATSTVSSTNTTIEDALLELGTGTTGTPSNDAGIVIERGSESNVFMGWDDSASSFILGTTAATGASTGALTITPTALSVGATTITNATNSGGTARNVYQSTSAPTGGDGAVGDLWILYS